MTTLNKRYTLQNILGEGGMGVVYRASDKLTGDTVALKLVQTEASLLGFGSKHGKDDDVRVALAREFRLLATVQHPNIIRVLDYGFDEHGNPFFTMPLIAEARDIISAVKGKSFREKVALILQVLLALAYLHRRGILHRDLKPANILVTPDERVHVLDFGVAVQNEGSDGIVGTVQYIAPEVLQGGEATRASDLYAVGVILFQMLTNHHPFSDSTDMRVVAQAVLDGDLDLMLLHDALKAEGAREMQIHTLMSVVKALLLREDRHNNAADIITALCAASNLPVPDETEEIRESFLAAAQLVGRDSEMSQLEAALEAILHPTLPRGSVWLIGGESGVGKSRLIDELRVRALVRGVTTLVGQGQASGTLAYHFWRDPLRRLILTMAPRAPKASILKAIVPDIESLLGIALSPSPAAAQQQQIVNTIVDLFRRIQFPVLLILEDLHHAGESLDPLHHILSLVEHLPLLIVGSYRDEERPTLPERLPGAHVMKLKRLSRERIAELSAAMIGDNGRLPEVVELLQRETEGNVYFLVETVRALAEEAGGLENVGRVTLPQSVFAGGIQKIVERRLAQVPPAAIPMLKAAAVMGRQLVPDILHLILSEAQNGTVPLDAWLRACADVAVIEFVDGHWRFVHDRLREGLLTRLGRDERQAIHRSVALALRQYYGDDLQHAADLAEHWRAAKDREREAHYARLAGEQALIVSDYEDALRYLLRALSLIPQEKILERKSLMKLVGDANRNLSRYESASHFYSQSLQLGNHYSNAAISAAALIGLADVTLDQGNYGEAETYIEEALKLTRTMDDRPSIAAALQRRGRIAWERGNLQASEKDLQESLQLSRELDDKHAMALTLNHLSRVARTKGTNGQAIEYLEQSLALTRQINDKRLMADNLNQLGHLASSQSDFDAAERYYQRALTIRQQIGDRWGQAAMLNNLGLTAERCGRLDEARHLLQESIAINQSIDDRRGVADNLCNLIFVELKAKQFERARDYTLQVLEFGIKQHAQPIVLEAMIAVAWLNIRERRTEHAAQICALVQHHEAVDEFVLNARAAPLREALALIVDAQTLARADKSGQRLDLYRSAELFLAQRR